MKAIELEKTYNPGEFEDRIYQYWEEGGYFKPAGDDSKEPFVIVIPPPNVTGVLHMGHGLNNSLQDILIRYQRMQGRPTLWVPGTDHAGIATQNVVERRLKEKGLGRHDLGREKFIEETWKVKEEHHSVITKQLKKIGASCDWSRERFTMDEGLSGAVREVFVTLFERGLIYKGEYLVNWCPSCGTALADDEVDHEEEQGVLHHVKYPLSDGSGSIEVATTRPETMFGDTAVAVHPEDERYASVVGKTLDLPLTDKKIKIITDTYCNREFGSGAVKITPAHDPNDWDIGNRHNLEKVNILNGDGTLNDNVPEAFRGMDVKTARKATVKALEEGGFLTKIEDQPHQVGHCYRCKSVIEPYMSDQWFVKMSGMAEKALKAWEEDRVRFYPKRWENTYTHWLKGIRDWCISRQLWWGHRIPAWTCADCGEILVERQDPSSCSKCGSTNIEQDPDVLDTWFSSWLWPFSTLGWPEKTADLEKFYPTSALVTGYDIIFFWVARMIMASEEFMEQAPFRDIYITPLVRDKQGRKMSKSLGNGIDPLDIVAQYGADAMKFTLAYLSAQGQDIPLEMEDIKLGSRFCNKVWNASRYILMNLEGRELLDTPDITLNAADKWIYHRLNSAIANVTKAVEVYRFDDMSHTVYEFFWNDFCDWYVEATKLYLYSKDDKEKDRAVSVLLDVLNKSLRLLHPFMSFLTEEIYQKLPGVDGPLITASFPVVDEALNNPELENNFAQLQDFVQSVRTFRSEFNIPPSKDIKVRIKTADKTMTDFMKSEGALVSSLIHCNDFDILDASDETIGSVTAVGKSFEAFLYIRDMIDVDKEIARLTKNIARNEKLFISTEKKLGNEKFTSKAPDEVIAKEKEKLEEFKNAIEKMNTYLAELKS
ncbi:MULTISPECIES: valine--tRNA ligase [unclassified Oceanispirochaeta]|uniref:valine--tRNA ligase n=1 Tax=unclassified Oceanispirochaeta TaxID=2635722 RepID=UPI000E090635|nr:MULTISPECIES: valine--tRNA ligase [unclassified Oceanispirochaeta]MBF9015618.1 valine--tRNA ligase [Oceanispirochaeta sp. M2]NPD73392.1 valine--tRNA ligase [Oceanispirochaeta sp. M1]RDG30866.1 valine--tRNA ligase [Oceanispirochaeta sp. M1]